jgi:adenine-specific DNA-methyltransferase
MRMKYMGSKRTMLTNGLGEALNTAIPNARGFVDLFTGSGAVASHVARHHAISVSAYDLQAFAAQLARTVVARTHETGAKRWAHSWVWRSITHLVSNPLYPEASRLQAAVSGRDIQAVHPARALCANAPKHSITRAYGGYYFSPLQALLLDELRSALPTNAARADVALAALIQAASKSAASPGHTAQPFKPNDTAGPFLLEAWSRNLAGYVIEAAVRLDAHFAVQAGSAAVSDASVAAKTLKEGDLAFLDPPYSAVHYSRFYHVLESIAQGQVGDVTGSGRYPTLAARPSSDFSMSSRAAFALENLLQAVSAQGASAIVTFPSGSASNGLSGDLVKEIADQHFSIAEAKVTSKFSTLGGDRKHREARQVSSELILTLHPK